MVFRLQILGSIHILFVSVINNGLIIQYGRQGSAGGVITLPLTYTTGYSFSCCHWVGQDDDLTARQQEGNPRFYPNTLSTLKFRLNVTAYYAGVHYITIGY